MKITRAKRTGVQSLGRHSIRDNSGNIASASALSNALSKGLTQIAGVLDRREQQKASLHMQRADQAFRSQYEGRDYLRFNEIPGHLQTEQMRIDGRVAASQILPQMYENHVSNALNEASKNITQPNSRGGWLLEKEGVAADRLGKLQAIANSAIETQILNEQIVEYKEQLEQGLVGEALMSVDEMGVPESKKVEFREAAHERGEIVIYENALAENDVDAIKGALDVAEAPYEEYQEAGGKLGPTDKMVWANKLRTRYNQLTTLTTTVDKRRKETARAWLNSMKKAAAGGSALRPQEVKDLMTELNALDALTGGEFTQEMIEFHGTVALAFHNDRMRLLPMADRFAYAAAFKPKNATDDVLKNHIVAANQATFIAMENDFARFVGDSGLHGPDGLVTIDVRSPNFGNQLAALDKQIQDGEINFKAGKNLDRFTNEQADIFSRQFNEMTPDDQLRSISTIYEAVGENADIIFGQLAVGGEAQTFAVAGSIMSYVPQHSETMLKGMRHRKSNPEEVSKLMPVLETWYLSDPKMYQLYSDHPKQHAAMKRAVEDHYIGTTMSAHGSLIQPNKEQYVASMKAVTGGSFTYNGVEFPVPEYDMKHGPMDEWIMGISQRYFEGNLPVRPSGVSYDAAEFTKAFRAQRFKMQLGADTGEYFLWAPSIHGDVPLMDANGKAWILKYDGSAPRWKDDPDAPAVIPDFSHIRDVPGISDETREIIEALTIQ